MSSKDIENPNNELDSETVEVVEAAEETGKKSVEEAAEPSEEKEEKALEEMTELVADKDDTKYTDDELEEMDVQRMAHVIMNDENRTNMDLLDEVMEDDAYSLKQKKKEAKRVAKLEKRKASGETGGIRFLGIMSIIMVLAGVALVLVTVYFLAIAPTYNKTDYLTHELRYPDSATLTDADYTQVKEGYYVPEIATSDAQPEQSEQGGEGLE